MDFKDLLKIRRSVRDFEDKEVPLEIVKQIITESCLAPSSNNGQPWRFIIINNKAAIEKFSNDSKKNLISDIEKNPASPIKKYEAALRDPGFNVFYKVSLYLRLPHSSHFPVRTSVFKSYFHTVIVWKKSHKNHANLLKLL